MIFGVIIMAIGVLINLYARKLLRPYEEYEFRNRSDGGVVQFESLQASKRHEWKKRWVNTLGGIGILIAALGFMITVFIFSFAK